MLDLLKPTARPSPSPQAQIRNNEPVDGRGRIQGSLSGNGGWVAGPKPPISRDDPLDPATCPLDRRGGLGAGPLGRGVRNLLTKTALLDVDGSRWQMAG